MTELTFAGLPKDIVRQALPYLTVWSGAKTIDPRLASPGILAALPHMTPARLKTLLNLRASTPGNMDSIKSALGEDAVYAGFENPRSLRLDVRVKLADGFTTEAQLIILHYRNDGQPYRVLNWQDRLENYKSLSSENIRSRSGE